MSSNFLKSPLAIVGLPGAESSAHKINDLLGMEYVHSFLSALPIFGLAVGVIGLIFAIRSSRADRLAALALMTVSAALVWPVCYYFGWHDVTMVWQPDENRWVGLEVRPREEFASLFLVVAAMSALALFSELKTPRAAIPLALATLLPAIVAVGLGTYMVFTDCPAVDRGSRVQAAPPAFETDASNHERQEVNSRLSP